MKAGCHRETRLQFEWSCKTDDWLRSEAPPRPSERFLAQPVTVIYLSDICSDWRTRLNALL